MYLSWFHLQHSHLLCYLSVPGGLLKFTENLQKGFAVLETYVTADVLTIQRLESINFAQNIGGGHIFLELQTPAGDAIRKLENLRN